MTVNLALEYIPRRMHELGFVQGYHLRMRHLRLRAGETRIIASYTHYFILLESPADMRIESEIGLFDRRDQFANELQYEHHGEIQITNLSPFPGEVRFIQVIPKS